MDVVDTMIVHGGLLSVVVLSLLANTNTNIGQEITFSLISVKISSRRWVARTASECESSVLNGKRLVILTGIHRCGEFPLIMLNQLFKNQ